MPPTETPNDPAPETPLLPEPVEQNSESTPEAAKDSPLSFVPQGTAQGAVRIRTSKYGELDAHELLRLLDTIEDERARGRFRESIYLSAFIWLAIAWLVFYGPRVLWHAPKLINPMDILQQRELTNLTLPSLPRTPRSVPAPHPTLDRHTLDTLRKMERETPAPPAPEPAPSAAPSAPATVTPPPKPAAPAPTPRVSTPLPSAPAPQPSARTFNNSPSTAGNDIANMENRLARGHSGTGTAFAPSPSNPLGGGVDVLSDTQGVDFNPYLRRILADIKRNWLPLIPAEAEPPLSKQGETEIRFTILPNGTIAAMNLDGSTHDDAINHSCWSAITSEGQFPPLPSQFHGPNLELRIHFFVNKNVE